MATSWRATQRKMRIERAASFKAGGRTPARKIKVWFLRTDVIAIPAWAFEQKEPGLPFTADYIWTNQSMATMLARLDKEEGGNPELFPCEARRCKVCGLLKLNLMAAHRRMLDESAVDGRNLPCGPECMTRCKQQKGEL
jgi:hypothetical protein